LNADEIARGLSPLNPSRVNRQAGELMIKRFHYYLNSGMNFVFETTAAGITYASHLKKAKESGYHIDLTYLWLSSAEQAIKRVALRVKQGGHNIPEEDIVRRYYRGLKNLIHLYLPLAHSALVVDNSSVESGLRKIIAKKDPGLQLQIEDNTVWELIQKVAHEKA
jgi:predicted ABC-type ATPase